MKTFLMLTTLSGLFLFSVGHYGLWDDITQKATMVHNYEYKALELARKNRYLNAEINKLKYQIQSLEAKRDYLALKIQKQDRKIASIPRQSAEDLVKYSVYKWTPDKLLAIGVKEFHFKHYNKAAQFYNEYITRFPKHSKISDDVLFQAGVSAYESKKHYKWAASHFKLLVEKYPRSRYFRGAKLWLALSNLNLGEHKKFMNTVDEFRKKYRNTEEWKILSRYYEQIAVKYKN